MKETLQRLRGYRPKPRVSVQPLLPEDMCVSEGYRLSGFTVLLNGPQTWDFT